MKKIFLFLVTASALVACDPVSEDISNGGHITVDELLSKTTVSLDKAPDGSNGNVVTCETHAPVNATWDIDGKPFMTNYYSKKLKMGEHNVTLSALCADGTLLETSFPLSVQTITDPLEKFYIYGDPEKDEKPVVLTQGDAAAGRFSDNEGKGLPYITDDVYWGFKTLILDVVTEPSDGGIWGEPAGPAMVRVMNGWWAATYQDDLVVESGLWELPITEAIAKDCAQGNGGDGKDLDILVRRGTITINSVYYEE